MERLVVTGQQIGVGWTPALSVVKALAALALAREVGGRALFWMADEDHDHLEVASTVSYEGDRLVRHRFRFAEPRGTATGWLRWTEAHQAQATACWGPLPEPTEPTLRGHVLALGTPLWTLGLEPYSPTQTPERPRIQATLEAWRALGLEDDLIRQAEHLVREGQPLPLDPRTQAAWFSLDPGTGQRVRLEPGDPCPTGCWLSPGAALRPLLQSLLLPVTDVVLGPAERAYWRLAEPLWARVGLKAPTIHPRPTALVVPPGCQLQGDELQALREGDWARLGAPLGAVPSTHLPDPAPDPAWPEAVATAFRAELERTRGRLARLDHKLARYAAAQRLGRDPERLRQRLFPLGRPQERVLPGWLWLRDPRLLQELLEGLKALPTHLTLSGPA